MCSISGKIFIHKIIKILVFKLFGVLINKYVCKILDKVKEDDMFKIVNVTSDLEIRLTKSLIKIIKKLSKRATASEIQIIADLLRRQSDELKTCINTHNDGGISLC